MSEQWKLADWHSGRVIDAEGHTVCTADPYYDAKLIAAAPDLLAALVDVMAQLSGAQKSCGHEGYCICPGDAARAAIAKARGVQS